MGITGTNNNSAKVYQCLTLSSVPENLRKKFFKCDKDGSGVLESSNMNGKNEIELMSKYWQDVSQNTIYGRVENKRTYSPEKPMRNNVYSSTIFDENGNKTREVQMNLTNFEYVETTPGSNDKFTYDIGYNRFTKLHIRNINAREKAAAPKNNSNSLF